MTGWAVETLSTTDSTQKEIRARLAQGAADGLVLRALRQTQGRGRMGRIWEGGAGNLMFSVLLRRDIPRDKTGQIALLAGVVSARAIAPLLTEPSVLRLKWPNDVLIAGRKCGGILAEAEGDALILGVGINVASAPLEAAACVDLHSDAPVDTAVLLDSWLSVFTEYYESWQKEGFEPVRAAWLAHGPVPGAAMAVQAGEGRLEGLFDGIADDGALLLRDPLTGRRKTVTAGDVFL